MKNKNFQILEIGTFLPLLVNLSLDTIKDRGNLLTYFSGFRGGFKYKRLRHTTDAK
jgi:hypothetical protein